tara:strand:+ start:4120 stop:5169 length:1050 start_codon:yes stop_codon:yes gene_type:complete
MSRKFNIGDVKITQDSECFVVAEIGANHMGKIDIAEKMILSAKESGANAVKFQKRNNQELFTQEMFDMPYINSNSFAETYGKHREYLEFDNEEYKHLIDFARQHDIMFFATPFDFQSVDFLEKFNLPAYKTASADITNTPFLEYIASTGRPMIVSTGGSSLDDVKRAYDKISKYNNQLSILQCSSVYPAQPSDMNLSVINTYLTEFENNIIGLSDHQSGIALALVGYVLGARIIEKHFTLNRSMKGTDQPFSLEPIGLKKLIRDLHRSKLAMGTGEKTLLENEKPAMFKLRKKLVASKDLREGTVLKKEDIAIKIPGDGTPPHELDYFIGKKINIAISKDEDLNKNQIS